MVFNIAKLFIQAKLSAFGGIRSSNLYHQVLEFYPEIRLGELSFRKYVSKIKASMVLPSQKLRYSDPVISWSPGEYMQVDIGKKSIVMSYQSPMKVYFVSFVLCYFDLKDMLHPINLHQR